MSQRLHSFNTPYQASKSFWLLSFRCFLFI